jgi:hypothetical protein
LLTTWIARHQTTDFPSPPLKMTASTMAANLCISDLMIGSLPATEALEKQQRTTFATAGRQACVEESKLSCALFSLNIEDDVNSFPTIEWESNASDCDSDSDSVRSLDVWNSFLTDFESTALGKRGRSDFRSRRLVRSKKIKFDLHSLDMTGSL